MSYKGDFALGSTFDLKFTSRKFSTGAPFTLAGSPVISAYPDNSTTQITAGITLSVDFDSVIGMNNVRVVATSGNGYAAGSNYDLVVTTGTVDSVSVVGEVVGSFSLEARSALRPATAGRTLVVDASGLADANTVKVGPTGSGTAQTARDIGASVLLSSGTGTGQLDFTSGVVKGNVTQLLGTAWLTPGTAGTPDVNVKLISADATAADNAEAFFDGTGYAGTNNVIPTVTTLTNDPTGVTTLLSRIPSGIFTGITSLAQWLGLIAGKQTGNTTARTELRATGAGSGTFDETTDSIEAIRDRGDAAWTTATGFSTHTAADVWAVGTRVLTAGTNIVLAKGTGVTGFTDIDAAGVRTAVGLASANLDTQIGDLPTNAELATALGTADDAVLAAIAALNNPSAASIATAVFTTAMTEAYAADGGTVTVAQGMYELLSLVGEFSIAGTTMTCKKRDGSTTALTVTLNDSANPTSRTRAT